MVAAAASIAAAASTALPPFWYIMGPAVAALGFPVMAVQCFPWGTGFFVRWVAARTARDTRARDRRFMDPPEVRWAPDNLRAGPSAGHRSAPGRAWSSPR